MHGSMFCYFFVLMFGADVFQHVQSQRVQSESRCDRAPAFSQVDFFLAGKSPPSSAMSMIQGTVHVWSYMYSMNVWRIVLAVSKTKFMLLGSVSSPHTLAKILQNACVRQGRRELFTMVIQKGRRWWVRLGLQACKRCSQGIRRKGRSTFHWGKGSLSKSFAIPWHSFCHDYIQRLPTTLLPPGRSYMDECDIRM